MEMTTPAQQKEAYNISEQVHEAGRIMEQAIVNTDPKAKKALRDAAKILIDSALNRFDESIGAAVLEDDDE